MEDDWNDESERLALVRALRQQLESLARAGLDRVGGSPAHAGAALSASPRRKTALPPLPQIREADLAMPARDDEHATPPHIESPPHSVPATISVSPSPPSHTAAAADSDLPAPSLAALFGSSTFDTPPVAACDRPARLGALAAMVAGCRRCPHLADTRTQTVFGVGNPETRLMFIGEAPGADEDRIGEPFVGRAGQLLTDIITKGMGLTREQVYIANILKCRPPENRTPSIDEANNCFPYLEQQIDIIRPEFICLLGKVAVQAILNTTHAMGKVRGKWHRYRGIPTIATYHPSYLLRTPTAKKDVWEDLQILMKEMGLVRPNK